MRRENTTSKKGLDIGELPLASGLRCPLIEIYGDMRVLVENHLGIQAYNYEEILIRTRIGVIGVHGECLNLRNMSKEKLVITGKIFSVNIQVE